MLAQNVARDHPMLWKVMGQTFFGTYARDYVFDHSKTFVTYC